MLSNKTAGDKPEEGEDDVKSSCPLCSGLPCYDFTPVTNPALGRCFQKVSSRTSGVVDFHGVTGGVYKTRERIQRSVLICVY